VDTAFEEEVVWRLASPAYNDQCASVVPSLWDALAGVRRIIGVMESRRRHPSGKGLAAP